MRVATTIAFAAIFVSLLGCDQGKSAPQTSSKSDESDKPSKKKQKDEAKSDDDDDDTPKKQKPKAVKGDDDDDKATGSKTPLPDKKALTTSVSAFFGGYADGATFDFYGSYFAPSVDKFLSLKSTTPAAMAKEARAFYAGKTGLKYTPQNATLAVVPDPSGERETLTVEVKMEWKAPPPKAWGTLEGQNIEHAHVATVEIVVGSDGKWTSYGEPGLKRDSYRVVAPDGTLGAWTTAGEVDNDDAAAPLKLKKGDVVQDGFETLVVDMNPKGEVVARKIHQTGKDWWALDHSAVAVDNPNGGTSAGEETYLEKVK